MKNILLAALAIQMVTLLRPLLGVIAYLTTKDTLASQRISILTLVTTNSGGGGVDSRIPGC